MWVSEWGDAIGWVGVVPGGGWVGGGGGWWVGGRGVGGAAGGKDQSAFEVGRCGITCYQAYQQQNVDIL